MHVSKKGFEEMIETAKEIGFDVYKRSGIIFSFAVALSKGSKPTGWHT